MAFNTMNMMLSMVMLNNAKLAQEKKLAASVGAAIMPGVLGLMFPLMVARNTEAGTVPPGGTHGSQAGSEGTLQTLVPDVQRMGEAQAIEAIMAAGLIPLVVRTYFKQIDGASIPPAGQVSAQHPAPSASWVDSGSEVTLQVSLGPQPDDAGAGSGAGEHAYHTAMETQISNRISTMDHKVDMLINQVGMLNGTDGAAH